MPDTVRMVSIDGKDYQCYRYCKDVPPEWFVQAMYWGAFILESEGLVFEATGDIVEPGDFILKKQTWYSGEIKDLFKVVSEDNFVDAVKVSVS